MARATPARRPAAAAVLTLALALLAALSGAQATPAALDACQEAESVFDLPDLARCDELGAAARAPEATLAERCAAARAFARGSCACAGRGLLDDARRARELLEGGECAPEAGESRSEKGPTPLAFESRGAAAATALGVRGTAGGAEGAVAGGRTPGAAALGRRGRPNAASDRARRDLHPLALASKGRGASRRADGAARAPRRPRRGGAAGSGSSSLLSARALLTLERRRARELAARPRPVSLFVGVVSASWNGARRQAIRETWGARGAGLRRVLFFLGEAGGAAEGDAAGGGAARPPRVPRALAAEHLARGGDLRIVPGVRESYWNITHQTLAVVCAGANMEDVTHVVKADDDSFLRPFDLRKALSRAPDRRLFWGALEKAGGEPNRDPADQWHVGEDEWPIGETYPAWAHGAGYALSIDVARAIARRFGCLEIGRKGGADGAEGGRHTLDGLGETLGEPDEAAEERGAEGGLGGSSSLGAAASAAAERSAAAALGGQSPPAPPFPFLDAAPPRHPPAAYASVTSSFALERALAAAVEAKPETAARDWERLAPAGGGEGGSGFPARDPRPDARGFSDPSSSSPPPFDPRPPVPASLATLPAIYPRPPPRLFRLEDVAMGSWVERVAAPLPPHLPLHLVRAKSVNFWGCGRGDVISHYVTARAARCLWDAYPHGAAEAEAGGAGGADGAGPTRALRRAGDADGAGPTRALRRAGDADGAGPTRALRRAGDADGAGPTRALRRAGDADGAGPTRALRRAGDADGAGPTRALRRAGDADGSALRGRSARARARASSQGDCGACRRYRPGVKEAAEAESKRAKAEWLDALAAESDQGEG